MPAKPGFHLRRLIRACNPRLWTGPQRCLALGAAFLTGYVGVFAIIEAWHAGDMHLIVEFQIPENYPETLFTMGKGRRDPHTKHPRAEYAYWFRVGFNDCRRRFLWTGIRWSTPLLDPYDDQSGPGLKQYGHYERRADEAGFLACRQQLRRLCDQHGVHRVRRALRWNECSSNEYWANIRHENAASIRLVAATLIAAVCISGIVKLANFLSTGLAKRSDLLDTLLGKERQLEN